jgi:hypothetical protein
VKEDKEHPQDSHQIVHNVLQPGQAPDNLLFDVDYTLVRKHFTIQSTVLRNFAAQKPHIDCDTSCKLHQVARSEKLMIVGQPHRSSDWIVQGGVLSQARSKWQDHAG